MTAWNVHIILIYATNVTWTTWATGKLDIPQVQKVNYYIM
jgi:hypothetical protein